MTECPSPIPFTGPKLPAPPGSEDCGCDEPGDCGGGGGACNDKNRFLLPTIHLPFVIACVFPACTNPPCGDPTCTQL